MKSRGKRIENFTMMTGGAYYNEIDPFAAAWLRELIKEGHIALGEVDERSIEDVLPSDLAGFTQCHFFAGIGGWSYALRLAGWSDDRPVWTGSCPCQPFSQAGKKAGIADERHLWPAFFHLIEHCGPSIVFGEQVASADGRVWLAGVRADLEGMGASVGAADLCAAGVTAPHLRQRLYWVGKSHSDGHEAANGRRENLDHLVASDGEVPGLGHAHSYHRHWWSGPVQVGWNGVEAEIERSGRKHRAQWRLKPSLSLLAHGIPGRVGQLCGFGNAIVPQVAAEFIRAAT